MKEEGIEKTYIHVITDGRDVSPHAALEDIKELKKKSKKLEMEKLPQFLADTMPWIVTRGGKELKILRQPSK